MSSKGYLAIWAGSALLALAGCDAGNQPAEDPGSPATEEPASDNMAMYEPDDSAGSQTDDPTTAEDPYSTTDPSTDPSMSSDDPMMGADQSQSQSGQSGMSGGQSLESMSTEEIVGTPILSATGEEIGNVEQVVKDPTSDQEFAVVDVGGFLGVGEKSIVVPLEELEATGEDRIKSDLTREALQTEQEYVPEDYEPASDSQQPMQ